jgi:hypothetical protein
MKYLFDNQFAPITFSPLVTVIDALSEWRKTLFAEVTTISLTKELPEALPQLEPLTLPPTTELLVATDSAWTAYFDNAANGGDPFGPISFLAETIKCCGLTVTCIPNTLSGQFGDKKGTYGAISFALFAPEPREWLNCERSVSAMNDGGRWRFDTVGIPQVFEDLKQYQAKRIKDRFTSDMLEQYCEALRIRLFGEKFYTADSLLISTRRASLNVVRTLAEARDLIGLPSLPGN